MTDWQRETLRIFAAVMIVTVLALAALSWLTRDRGGVDGQRAVMDTSGGVANEE